MKLLLVANEDKLKSTLENYTDIHGGSIIHYKIPLKSMDNFDEIEPDVILFNGLDYPRHWKLAAKILREKRNRKSALFILLIDKNFNSDEADKAAYLGVNALIPLEDLKSGNMKRLEALINRYKIAPERSNGPVFHKLKTPCPLMFMNPSNLRFVSGKVEKELADRILFFPFEPASINSIEEGTLIRNCSMEQEGKIQTFDCLVKSRGEYLELQKIDQNETKGIA